MKQSSKPATWINENTRRVVGQREALDISVDTIGSKVLLLDTSSVTGSFKWCLENMPSVVKDWVNDAYQEIAVRRKHISLEHSYSCVLWFYMNLEALKTPPVYDNVATSHKCWPETDWKIPNTNHDMCSTKFSTQTLPWRSKTRTVKLPLQKMKSSVSIASLPLNTPPDKLQ